MYTHVMGLIQQFLFQDNIIMALGLVLLISDLGGLGVNIYTEL